MKSVLITSLAYFPKLVGGAEIATNEITDRITDLRFTMVTIRGDHEHHAEKIGNIMVYRVGPQVNTSTLLGKVVFKISKYLYPFLAYNRARILHRQSPFDCVWSIMANHAGFAALFFKKKYPKVRFVLTLQEGDPIPYILKKVRFVKGWFRQIFLHADHVTAISSYLLNFARDMGYKGEGSVIGNGVDIDHFSQHITEEEKGKVRAQFGFNAEDIVVITVSRLVKKNGISDTIDAMALLPNNYKFLILGTGELEDALKKQVNNLHLEDRVKFAGFIPHSSLPVYLKSSDIFIRPSLSEGLGNSFLEAMAAGIPVIATPVGGIPDFLEDGITGLFCNVTDPHSISKQIKKLDDIQLKNNITTVAFERVKDRYDWVEISARLKNIL